ncbi:MAG: hypothetical protein OCD76_25350 [Reichenbachiella sp.]
MKNLAYIFSLSILVLMGCKEDEIDPKVSFVKIYDNFRSDVSYDPIDIVETDSGFLVLARQDLDNSSLLGVQLLQLDEEGDFVSETTLADNLAIPVGDIVTIEGINYFFMMDKDTYVARMGRLNSSVSSLEIIELNGFSFPLAANISNENELLLTSYNATSGETIISRLDTDGNQLQSAAYSTGPGDDVRPDILQHFIDPERSGLPFFCGQLDASTYYFNGFYNYNLSTVFTTLGGSPTGTIQGQGTNGGITSLLPLTNGSFSMFGYQFNDNFIQPVQTINIAETGSSVDYMSLTFSEYKSRAHADIALIEIAGTEYSIIGAETESRQIALNFYDTTTGESKGILKIGNINPYSLSSIRVDSENNLLVLGSTLIAGRFSRVFFQKISEKEISALVN